MNIKIGDTVRYLNAVGGGIVTRISDGIAYVDDDGFETPVLIRECVVVGTQSSAIRPEGDDTQTNPKYNTRTQGPKDETPHRPKLPVIETNTGNVLNVILGFEADNIKSLSQSSFDAYIVNDSNYYLYLSICSRSNDEKAWTLRYDGLVEPNIQEFVFELKNNELAKFDRLSVQYIAFKRNGTFALKQPAVVDLKVDATKFAKLHCFKPNPYFDVPVICYEIAVDDVAVESLPAIDPEKLAQGLRIKSHDIDNKRNPGRQITPRSKTPKRPEVIEVDLHASELLDSTAGLSSADILNIQIDRFSQVMTENLRHPGQKIVFIHGKGEGVLRQALMKELTHRYKGHDVQDASFREYGFGATQVTIRHTDNRNFSTDRKKSK